MTDSEEIGKVRTLAAICHEVNRAYCRALGDESQLSWRLAPEWQKESAIKGVNAHLRDETLTGRGSHALWCKEKVDTGWKYGPVKDPEKKEHPCLVDYEELPFEQKVKDYLFKAVIEGAREASLEHRA